MLSEFSLLLISESISSAPRFAFRLLMNDWEHVTCMKTIALRFQGNLMKTYIAVGTANCFNEDVVSRGRVILFDIIEVVPELNQPLTKHKLKVSIDRPNISTLFVSPSHLDCSRSRRERACHCHWFDTGISRCCSWPKSIHLAISETTVSKALPSWIFKSIAIEWWPWRITFSSAMFTRVSLFYATRKTCVSYPMSVVIPDNWMCLPRISSSIRIMFNSLRRIQIEICISMRMPPLRKRRKVDNGFYANRNFISDIPWPHRYACSWMSLSWPLTKLWKQASSVNAYALLWLSVNRRWFLPF